MNLNIWYCQIFTNNFTRNTHYSLITIIIINVWPYIKKTDPLHQWKYVSQLIDINTHQIVLLLSHLIDNYSVDSFENPLYDPGVHKVVWSYCRWFPKRMINGHHNTRKSHTYQAYFKSFWRAFIDPLSWLVIFIYISPEDLPVFEINNITRLWESSMNLRIHFDKKIWYLLYTIILLSNDVSLIWWYSSEVYWLYICLQSINYCR